MQWSFKRFQPGDKAREPQVEKFFKGDAVADRATAVIREGIQNSLDAAESSPVRIRIHLATTSPAGIAPFAANLQPHLDAVRAKLPHVPRPADAVPYLVFEDFNTKGLTGNPFQWKPEPGSKNAFFNFFRGEGLTEKSGTDRGRHGVGKMVFALASRARCLFGFTIRNSDSALLMGASVLGMHDVGPDTFHPDGWFGQSRPVNQVPFVAPLSQAAHAAAFEAFGRSFEISRTIAQAARPTLHGSR